MNITYGSLFTGIGGFDLGLDRSGMKCEWQVEKDEYCQRILQKHWPHVRRHRDIFECGRHNLSHVDVICGGDPCQENSNARQGTGLSQPSLGAEFIRIVDELRPRIVVRENPSTVRSDAPWPWSRFRSSLEGIGYDCMPFRLRSCCFGADHRRDRLFLLAIRSDSNGSRLQGNVQQEMERARIERMGDTSRCNRRHPTPRICTGSDGIPDRMARLKAIGNSVDPNLSEWIGRRIVESELNSTL